MTEDDETVGGLRENELADMAPDDPMRALVADLIGAYPFPEPEAGDDRGLLAYGGDLAPDRLLAAYAQGVFPWYSEEPILWFSPDPRLVLRPAELTIPKSLAKRMRQAPFEIRMDTAFRQVIEACRDAKRPGQEGTWITQDMVEAYDTLSQIGFAHSVEAWDGETLVGGLYGVSLGGAFFGESMFALAPDASKLAFAAFVETLGQWGFHFVDCQVETEHLLRFGATNWAREDFRSALARALEKPTRRGPWSFADSP